MTAVVTMMEEKEWSLLHSDGMPSHVSGFLLNQERLNRVRTQKQAGIC